MSKIHVYPEQVLNPIDRKILGHFVEQFPRNIPGGIFDPANPLSDEDGFRKDLLDTMRDVKVSQLRWAGNFSSHYHWMDAVGPKENRPKKINFAWDLIEDNHYGTCEFVKMCRKIGCEPIIGVNMGSGTPEEAMAWVEYCNGTDDTYYANLRRSHGYEEPLGVKYWCVGNEMYGVWQFGFQNAEDYSKSALHFAMAMKRADPSIVLTMVGLESDPYWNLQVVRYITEHTRNPERTHFIDYISGHNYAAGGHETVYANADYYTRMTMGAYFHEMTRKMRDAIEIGAADTQSPIMISWDEWNPNGPLATMENCMMANLTLNSFIKDSKYVGMANYTFFINDHGPVQTTETGYDKYAEYYMFKLYGEYLGSKLVKSRCEVPVKELDMPSDNRYNPATGKPNTLKRDIPMLDVFATVNDEGKLTLFVTNLDRDEDITATISLEECKAFGKAKMHTIWNEKLLEPTLADDNTVVVSDVQGEGNEFTATFKCHSINVIEF